MLFNIFCGHLENLGYYVESKLVCLSTLFLFYLHTKHKLCHCSKFFLLVVNKGITRGIKVVKEGILSFYSRSYHSVARHTSSSVL